MHKTADLSDLPRYLLIDALTWESGRIIRTWTYRWPVEVFHEFCKQVAGFESAQQRHEEAGKRHFCLSRLAQSLLHPAPLADKTSEQLSWADDAQPSLGQHRYSLAREALVPPLQLAKTCFC